MQSKNLFSYFGLEARFFLKTFNIQFALSKTFVQPLWMRSKTIVLMFMIQSKSLFKHFGYKFKARLCSIAIPLFKLFRCKARFFFKHFGCKATLLFKHFRWKARLFFKIFGCKALPRLLLNFVGAKFWL